MEDKPQKIEASLTAPSALAISDAEKKQPDAKKAETNNPELKTAGQKVHKWVTYLGIDWIFNTIAGASFAYAAKQTDFGKKVWSEPITGFFKKGLSFAIKDQEMIQKSAEKGNMFVSIIAGGMFTIPPLMVLENNKVEKKFVKFYDGIIYGKDKVENDPKFQAAYEQMGHEPAKGFWTGMKARGVALAPLLAIVLIPKTQKIADKHYFDHIAGASEKGFKAFGFPKQKLFKGVESAEASTRWKFIHDNVAMDAGLGLPYAGLHAFFYSKFAKDAKPEDKAKTLEVQPDKQIIADAPKEKKFADEVDKGASESSHTAREIVRKAEAETSAPSIGG